MLNLTLGTFYAMSVFMLPLEKEFGWTRAQTSWVTTIGVVLLTAWFVVAGYIQDRRGPKPVALIGGSLFSLGLLLASYTQSLTMFYLTAGVEIEHRQRHVLSHRGRGDRHRQRIRVRRA